MDSSPQGTSSVSDEFGTTLPVEQEGDVAGVEEHIHLPNPSFWPILLTIAIALTVGGLIFWSKDSFPWLSVIAAPFVLVGILGFGLEDPMAPVRERYVPVYGPVDTGKFKIGQNVIDAQGNWLGKIQARFSRYILVERGRLVPKVYYVPRSAIKEQIKHNTVFLTLSEDDLVRRGLTSVPNDIYDEVPEYGIPTVRGTPLFARRPLSPAETGHYNYGKHWPGINTDASGSYHREEVLPVPQTYVTEGVVATEEPIPPRTLNPD
jgi:hypothetical protein